MSKRPTSLEVNLDFELEKLLKEIHYLSMEPFNLDLKSLLKDKFNEINDQNKLRFYSKIKNIFSLNNILFF